MKTITGQTSYNFTKILPNDRNVLNPRTEKNKRHYIIIYQL